MEKHRREPRIILWDLETLPNMKEAMKIFPSLSSYPGLSLKATINSIICCGWKVLGSNRTHCINAWDFKEWDKDINDDKKLVTAAFEVLKDADTVVTHNGRRFDWKFLQTRLMKHNLPPLPKIRHVDTCVLLKSNLFMFNNKLNTAGEILVNEQKLDHEGWGLWVKVSERDPKAMKTMEAYCKQDVNLLEKVYLRLRPFAKEVSNHNLFGEGEIPLCPTCGSQNIIRDGWRTTKTGTFQRLRCRDCASNCQIGVKKNIPS